MAHTHSFAITYQPEMVAEPGVPFTVVAEVRNLITNVRDVNANGPAFLTIASATSGTQLVGTVEGTVVNGEVVFENVIVNSSGRLILDVVGYEAHLGLVENVGFDGSDALRYFDARSGDIDEARVCKNSGVEYNIVEPEGIETGDGGLILQPNSWFEKSDSFDVLNINYFNGSDSPKELTVLVWGRFESESTGKTDGLWGIGTVGSGSSGRKLLTVGFRRSGLHADWDRDNQSTRNSFLSSNPTGSKLLGFTFRYNPDDSNNRYLYAYINGQTVSEAGGYQAREGTILTANSETKMFVGRGASGAYGKVSPMTLRQLALWDRAMSSEEMLEHGRLCGVADPITTTTDLLIGNPRLHFIPPSFRSPRGPLTTRIPVLPSSTNPEGTEPRVVAALHNDLTVRIYFGTVLNHAWQLQNSHFSVIGGAGESVAVTAAHYSASNVVVLTLEQRPSSGVAHVTVEANAVLSDTGNLGNVETTLDFNVKDPIVPPPPPAEEPLVAFFDTAKLRIIFSSEFDLSYPLDFANFVLSSGSIESIEYASKHEVAISFAVPPATVTSTITIADGAVRSKDGVMSSAGTFNFVTDDLKSPTVTNIYPAPGEALRPSSHIEFSVLDNGNLSNVLVVVQYDTLGRVEVAHDGVQFCSGYVGLRTNIEGGYRYKLLRLEKWLAAPKIRVFAVDTAGNEL